MISGELVMRVENIEATVGFSCHSDPSESNYEINHAHLFQSRCREAGCVS